MFKLGVFIYGPKRKLDKWTKETKKLKNLCANVNSSFPFLSIVSLVNTFFDHIQKYGNR